MINMKNTSTPTAAELAGDAPDYPYGLRITLNSDALDKLGIAMLPAPGGKFLLNAQCTVVYASTSASEGGEANSSVELQITDMELEKQSGSAQSLYTSSGMNP